MNRWYLLIVTLWLSASVLSGCAASQPSASDGKLRVLVTTGQVADAVRNIGGEHVALTALLGPGIDPHTYVATESDIFALQEAQVIFYNGLHLEAQMARVFEEIAASGKITVVSLGDRLDPERLLAWQGGEKAHDPHIWNDVQLWKQAIAAIGSTLAQVDPANAADYAANLNAYTQELDALDSYIHNQVANIPAEKRVLLTAHDAFGYFGRAYGIEVEAVQGISTQAEAGTADIQALAKLIVERQIPAVFVESTISPRTIEAVQAAVQAAGFNVKLGGQLYSDALGEVGSGADTYVTMMRHNIDTFVSAMR